MLLFTESILSVQNGVPAPPEPCPSAWMLNQSAFLLFRATPWPSLHLWKAARNKKHISSPRMAIPRDLQDLLQRLIRWLLGDLRLPSSQSASFLNKVVFLASTPHLIYWPVVLQAKRASAQFSSSVVSNSLQPHGRQHTRPLCSSLTPRVYPNSCPLSWWCHPTISSSVELRLSKNIRGSNTPCVVVAPKGKGAPKKTSLGPWDGQVWTGFHCLPNKGLHVWLKLAGELPSWNPGAKLWWNNPHLSWIFQQPLWSSK